MNKTEKIEKKDELICQNKSRNRKLRLSNADSDIIKGEQTLPFSA